MIKEEYKKLQVPQGRYFINRMLQLTDSAIHTAKVLQGRHFFHCF